MTLQTLTSQLAEALLERKSMMATAESCTGGLIAKTLTDLAGSSRWFERGFVTYSNQSKIDMLGVTESNLQQHGAVSEVVVQAMASGAIKNSRADYSLAVTGIAGPDGGSDGKPLGLVWFGWASVDQVITDHQVFTGNREQIREQTTEYALNRLLLMINQA